MKKITSLFLTLALLVTLAVPFTVFAADANTIEIYTAAELSALTDDIANNKGNTYNGKTISIMADIDMTGEEWYVSPDYQFAGSINGNGHTISGIYAECADGNKQYGLFGSVGEGKTVTIENLVIVNSKMLLPDYSSMKNETEANNVGINVGGLYGGVMGKVTLSNLYVDLDMVAPINDGYAAYDVHSIGGLIGWARPSNAANVESNIVFENCVVASDINVGENYWGVGGFIGRLNNNSSVDEMDIAFKNCAFYGSVKGKSNLGGYVGRFNTGNYTFTDCVVAGTIEATAGTIGAFCNSTQGGCSPTVTVTNCYNTTSYTSCNVITSGTVTSVSYADLSTQTGLDDWTVLEDNGMIVPITDAATLEAVEKATAGSYSTAWYDADSTALTISNAAELQGFSMLLEKGTTFAGQTITLANDIDFNPGWDAATRDTEPTRYWANTAGKSFAGTFDGGYHTISGLAWNDANQGSDVGFFGNALDGAVVQNLAIENSYLGMKASRYGAIFGTANTGAVTLKNLYVNVLMNDTDGCSGADILYIGGLVAEVNGGTLNIEGCVVDGTINAGWRMGIGGLVGVVRGSGKVTFKNSAFYGTINQVSWCEAGGSADSGEKKAVGGFLGRQRDPGSSSVTFDNCISAAKAINTISQIEGKSGTGIKAAFMQCIDGNANFTATNSIYVLPAGVTFAIRLASYGNGEQATMMTKLTADALTGINAAAALKDNGLTNWKMVTDSCPIPAGLAEFFETIELFPEADENGTKFVGYQLSKAANGEFSIRLIAVVDSLNYSAVGFNVSLLSDTFGTEAITYNENITEVYESLTAYDENGDQIIYTAAELGGQYIFALNITDIKTNTADMSFTVSTFGTTASGTVTTAETNFEVTPATIFG
ncbi:MAG: hypothetical protein IKC59_03355 [Clostridia bacterium]|nr:hypothetical protein [Clostridia bacterium]